jgi:hypothetical protein
MTPKRVKYWLAIAVLGAAVDAHAQSFDYDPARSAALRACDERRDHGRTAEARNCYTPLTRSPNDLLTQAEATWALGDVRRANDLFRDALKADDESVRTRVR